MLAQGHRVFLGPPSRLPAFLEDFGCPVPAFANSTEFALDLILQMQQQGEQQKHGQIEDKRGYEEDVSGDRMDVGAVTSSMSKPRQHSSLAELLEFSANWSLVHSEEKVTSPFIGADVELGVDGETEGRVNDCTGKQSASVKARGGGNEVQQPEYANNRWRELLVLLHRTALVTARTPSLYVMRVALMLVTGFLLATIFWHPPYNQAGLRDRLAFLSMMVCTLFFISADATPVFIMVGGRKWHLACSYPPTHLLNTDFLSMHLADFMAGILWTHIINGSVLHIVALPSLLKLLNDSHRSMYENDWLMFGSIPHSLSQERNLFLRETSHNTYRPSTYILSNTLVFLPLHLLMALTITAVSWWPVGLSGGAPAFLFLTLLCFTCLFTGNAIATLVSAAVNSVILAYAIVITLVANFTIVCGFYIPRSRIPPFWLWLHYLSPVTYAYEAAALNQFDE